MCICSFSIEKADNAALSANIKFDFQKGAKFFHQLENLLEFLSITRMD